MFKRLVILVMSLLLMPVYAQDTALEDIRFFLTFVPNIQFSPLYVTDAKGYIAEIGFTLSLEHGDENLGVDLIASNDIPFGMISGEQVIMARAGGRPVVYVYEWFQKYPVGIVIPDTTDAASIEELEGHKVGIPGRFGASYSGLTALLTVHDMTESDIQLEPIGFAAADVVCVGGVEASVIYVNNEPLQIQQRADAGECGDIKSVHVLYVADYVDMVSNGIVTSEAMIEDNPDVVRDILAAYERGLQDTINNPAEAYLISLAYVENLPIDDDLRAALTEAADLQNDFLETDPSREAIAESRESLLETLSAQFDADMLIQLQVLIETVNLWDAEDLGYTDTESWALTMEVLDSMGMLSGSVELDGAYTNDFLPSKPSDE